MNDLHAILRKNKIESERLFFSINSYMRYCLSDHTIQEDKVGCECICSDYFSFNGTEGELKYRLSAFMSESDSQSLINNLSGFAECFDEDEYVQVQRSISYPNDKSKMMHFLTQSSSYNINIKAITLISIALLLDIKITLGFVSAALAVIGIIKRL